MRCWFVILVSLGTACSSVPKEYLQNDSICKYEYSIFAVSKKEMILDMKKYDSILAKLGNISTENENYRQLLFRHPIYKTITNKQTNIEKTLVYEEGKIIVSYFQYYNGDTEIYKETHYDKNGAVTEVIDHEAGYAICWAEALAIVTRKLKKGYGNPVLGRTQRIQNGDTLYIWNVFVVKEATDNRPRDVKYYEVNAQTGKFRIKNVTYSDTALPLPEDWEDWRKN